MFSLCSSYVERRSLQLCVAYCCLKEIVKHVKNWLSFNMVYHLGCLRYYSNFIMCFIYAINFLPLMESDDQVVLIHSQVILKFCILSGMYKKTVD